jgi:hypothetical protein
MIHNKYPVMSMNISVILQLIPTEKSYEGFCCTLTRRDAKLTENGSDLNLIEKQFHNK